MAVRVRNEAVGCRQTCGRGGDGVGCRVAQGGLRLRATAARVAAHQQPGGRPSPYRVRCVCRLPVTSLGQRVGACREGVGGWVGCRCGQGKSAAPGLRPRKQKGSAAIATSDGVSAAPASSGPQGHRPGLSLGDGAGRGGRRHRRRAGNGERPIQRAGALTGCRRAGKVRGGRVQDVLVERGVPGLKRPQGGAEAPVGPLKQRRAWRVGGGGGVAGGRVVVLVGYG